VGPLLERAVLAAGDDPARPIELDVPADVPPVRADADRIHQVLANLLANARKYSPAGGVVRVSAAHHAGGPDESPGVVEIAVRDSGLGLPADARPRLFTPFYRVEDPDDPDRRAIPGTGLGLAICRQIVEAHKGRIWAASDGPGRGSTFAFTLPAAPAAASAPEANDAG